MMRNDKVLGPFRLYIFPSPLCVCFPPLSIIPHSVQEANLSRNGWPRSSSTPSRHSQWQRFWPSHLDLQVPSLVPRTSMGHYLGRGNRCPSLEQVANTKEKNPVILFLGTVSCWEFLLSLLPAAPLGGHNPPVLCISLPGIHFIGDATAVVSRSSDVFSAYTLAPGLTLSLVSGKIHFYRIVSQHFGSPGIWVSTASSGLVLSPVTIRCLWGVVRGLGFRQGWGLDFKCITVIYACLRNIYTIQIFK